MTFDLTPLSNFLAVGPVQAAMACQLCLVRASDNLLIKAEGTDSLEAMLTQALGEGHGVTYSEFNWVVTLNDPTKVLAIGVINDGNTRLVVPTL